MRFDTIWHHCQKQNSCLTHLNRGFDDHFILWRAGSPHHCLAADKNVITSRSKIPARAIATQSHGARTESAVTDAKRQFAHNA
jgi:hypothetical protein